MGWNMATMILHPNPAQNAKGQGLDTTKTVPVLRATATTTTTATTAQQKIKATTTVAPLIAQTNRRPKLMVAGVPVGVKIAIAITLEITIKEVAIVVIIDESLEIHLNLMIHCLLTWDIWRWIFDVLVDTTKSWASNCRVIGIMLRRRIKGI